MKIIGTPDERFVVVPSVEILHGLRLDDALVFVKENPPKDLLVGAMILFARHVYGVDKISLYAKHRVIPLDPRSCQNQSSLRMVE